MSKPPRWVEAFAKSSAPTAAVAVCFFFTHKPIRMIDVVACVVSSTRRRTLVCCCVGSFSPLTSLSPGFLWLCCNLSTSRPQSRSCEAKRSRDGREGRPAFAVNGPDCFMMTPAEPPPVGAVEFLDESFSMLSPLVWSKTPGHNFGVDIAGNLPTNPRCLTAVCSRSSFDVYCLITNKPAAVWSTLWTRCECCSTCL